MEQAVTDREAVKSVSDMTAGDAFEFARKFYEPYILRGDTYDHIRLSWMGMGHPDFGRVSTGGLLSGKQLPNHIVGVKLKDGRCFTFQLKDMFTATLHGRQLFML